MPETNDNTNNQGVLTRIATSVAETVKQAIAPPEKQSPDYESLSESQAKEKGKQPAETAAATTETTSTATATTSSDADDKAQSGESAEADENKGILSMITDKLKNLVGLRGPGDDVLKDDSETATAESQGDAEQALGSADKAGEGKEAPATTSAPQSTKRELPEPTPAQAQARTQLPKEPQEKPVEKQGKEPTEELPGGKATEEKDDQKHPELGEKPSEELDKGQAKPTQQTTDQKDTQLDSKSSEDEHKSSNPLAGLNAAERYEKAKEILGEPAKKVGGMRVKDHGESHLTHEVFRQTDKEKSRKVHEEHLELPATQQAGALITNTGAVKLNPNPAPRNKWTAHGTKAVASTYFPPQPTHAIPHKGSSRDETWSSAS